MTENQARAAKVFALIAGAFLVLREAKAIINPPAPTPGGYVNPANESTVGATITAAQAGVMADAIETAIYGGGLFESPTEDEAAVIAILASCANTADVRLLMNVYGERGSWLNKKNLVQTITSYLSTDDIGAINADFAARGITIRF